MPISKRYWILLIIPLTLFTLVLAAQKKVSADWLTDFTKPIVSITTSPSTNTPANTPITIDADSQDTGSGLNAPQLIIRLSPTPPVIVTPTVTITATRATYRYIWTPTITGAYTIELNNLTGATATVVDKAGNKEQTAGTSSITFQVDNALDAWIQVNGDVHANQ